MNFLVHAQLAGDSDEYLLGSVLGDFIKGSDLSHLPCHVQSGVRFHRKVDVFSDTHDYYRDAKSILLANEKRYSAIVLDIYCDYLLGQFWHNFSADSFERFCQRIYALIAKHDYLVPLHLRPVLKKLVQEQWFHRYQTIEGIEYTLQRVRTRLSRDFNLVQILHDFLANPQLIEDPFCSFYADLRNFARAHKSNHFTHP